MEPNSLAATYKSKERWRPNVTAVGKQTLTMKRRRFPNEWDAEQDERHRMRPVRLVEEQDEVEEPLAGPAASCDSLPNALLGLCSRFRLEPWAAARDDTGLWGFASAFADWLEHAAGQRPSPVELKAEAVRLLTNLLIILGAVTRLPSIPATSSIAQAAEAIAAARKTNASGLGPISSFPGAGRAMERLIRVRGWDRLGQEQQALGEGLLALYLETLAALAADPDPGPVLVTSEAWLTVLHAQALPAGFDERMLRATSWYLETYLSSVPAR
jgi:hypothetical protein